MQIRQTVALFLVSLLVLMHGSHARAQTASGLSSNGTDFYLASLRPSVACDRLLAFQGTYALVTTMYDNVVQVSYFDSLGHEVVGPTYTVQARHYLQIPLDLRSLTPLHPDGEVPEFRSCHITAKSPVSCQYYSTGPNSGGATIILPTPVLGKKYLVATLPSNPGIGVANFHHFTCTIDSSSAEFIVIATKDYTRVIITPATTTLAGTIGVQGSGSNGLPHPDTVALNRGETYLVLSRKDSINDISGSTVMADKPVAVIAGNGAAYNGSTQYVSSGGDQRNMLVQQMVPMEYWGREYLSMPLLDAPSASPNDPSRGERYTAYSLSNTRVHFVTGDAASTQSISQYSPASIENDTTGTVIESDSVFMPILYDYRQMTGVEPSPAPTELNLIPMTGAVRRAMIAAPDEKNQVHKRHYLNIIVAADHLSKMQVWLNGIGPRALNGLPVAGRIAAIPGHADLIAARYEIQPGTYDIQSDTAFLAYQYGMLGLDPDFDLGDNDDDDYYYEYASPAAETFASGLPIHSQATATSYCNGWTITATSGMAAPLVDGVLLNDPAGVIVAASTDSGYVSTNVRVVDSADLVENGVDSAQFRIEVIDPDLSANAYVWFVNAAGNDTLLHLAYTPPLVADRTSINTANVNLGYDSCFSLILRNKGVTSTLVQNLGLRNGSQSFTVPTTVPPLPAKIAPGDSLVINVCFEPVSNSVTYQDSLIVAVGCEALGYRLTGNAYVNSVGVPGNNFGDVPIGDTACAVLTIQNPNRDTVSVSLDTLVTSSQYYVSTPLPVRIAPLDSGVVTVCFTPKVIGPDYGTIYWKIASLPPFEVTLHTSSSLAGTGTSNMSVSKASSSYIPELQPNPVSGNVLRILGLNPNTASEITVMNMLGQVVDRTSSEVGATEIEMPVNRLPNGAYMIRIYTDGKYYIMSCQILR